MPERDTAPTPSKEQISEAQRTSNALAEAAAEAEERQADETAPGGRYKLSADGPLVDASGKEIKD